MKAIIQVDEDAALTLWDATGLDLYALYPETGEAKLLEDDLAFNMHYVHNGQFGVKGAVVAFDYSVNINYIKTKAQLIEVRAI